ncbi:MAG: malate dehydrogenase [Deltaproteobacteria bacterium]|nr:MAG: malate dehydrogenase [Deltaproteobacteria bacterium]
MKKVTIVGAGNVGSTIAMKIFEKDLADIVLIDVVEGLAEGKALDIKESAPIKGHNAHIAGYTKDYSSAQGSDIVIITAGITRKPGMSRDDLLSKNMEIVEDVVKNIVKFAPESILIIVSNPLDAMCHVAYEVSGFQRERVMGMAGVLDSIRFCTFIAEELNISVENVQALVLGGHGDSMVPLPRYTTVCGIPIVQLLEKERIEKLIKRTREAGAEIVSLLKTGSAYYAPAASTVEMVEAILKDKKKILPCSVLLKGEYGVKDLFLGVPVKLGQKGVEDIIEIDLSKEEAEALHNSAEHVRRLVEKMKQLRANRS